MNECLYCFQIEDTFYIILQECTAAVSTNIFLIRNDSANYINKTSMIIIKHLIYTYIIQLKQHEMVINGNFNSFLIYLNLY